MADLIYYSTFALTMLLSVVTFWFNRSKVISGMPQEKSATCMALWIIIAGLFSGTLYLHGAVTLVEHFGYTNLFGEREVFVVAPLFNMVLSLALAGIGKTLLRWNMARW